MTDTRTLFAHIEDRLNDERRKLESVIASGRIEDFAEYKRLCGYIQGIDAANEIITSLAKRNEEQEDDGY